MGHDAAGEEVIVAFDTETACFGPGNMAPPLTCVSFEYEENRGARLVHQTEAQDLVATWLAASSTLVGHNVAYDMAVLMAEYPDLIGPIFTAYEEDRVTDTMIRQQLLDIAQGCYRGYADEHGVWHKHNYSLLDVTRRLTGRLLEKDEWRMRYGEFRDVPLDWWPEGARHYPKEDARATLDCYLVQEAGKDLIPSQYHEARAALALHLMSVWGLRTNAAGVEQLRAATQAQLDDVIGVLREAGFVRADGSRDTKAAAARMEAVMGARCRRTPTGRPQLDGDSCDASEDPLLVDYGQYTTLGKVLSTDVPMLEAGTVTPVHTRFNLAESGRTTSSGPNIQNLRRLPGVREAFVPRPGHVFAMADYGALELWSLAQVQLHLFGRSHLAEVLNSGRDPHTALAADILGITYEDAAKRKKDPHDKELGHARQLSKAANFGYPGGLGPVKFVKFAASSGINISLETGKELRAAWFKRWPEMEPYFAHINDLTNNPAREATVVLPVTGMIRSGASFCAAANTYFQGLGAAAAKRALWLLAKACYADATDALYGCRPCAFIHDEIIVEVPDDDRAAERAERLSHLMREGARQVMSECVPPAEPILTRYWSKNAIPIKKDGQLVPWSE